MVHVDGRTPAERLTHRLGVVARDKFMSGWGGASGGASRCAWAAAPDVNITRLEDWVRRRPEMCYVNVVDLSTYRPPRGTAHFHIYLANTDHPGA
jgi:hypothetical protein